ncbi:unnamed protein product [Parajaminaea phylloscopi]
MSQPSPKRVRKSRSCAFTDSYAEAFLDDNNGEGSSKAKPRIPLGALSLNKLKAKIDADFVAPSVQQESESEDGSSGSATPEDGSEPDGDDSEGQASAKGHKGKSPARKRSHTEKTKAQGKKRQTSQRKKRTPAGNRAPLNAMKARSMGVRGRKATAMKEGPKAVPPALALFRTLQQGHMDICGEGEDPQDVSNEEIRKVFREELSSQRPPQKRIRSCTRAQAQRSRTESAGDSEKIGLEISGSQKVAGASMSCTQVWYHKHRSTR